MNQAPLCKCHNQPMRWINNKSLKRGGTWNCVVKLKQRNDRYVQNHPDRVKASKRKWSVENIEKEKIAKENWRINNRERSREMGRIYWASKMNDEGFRLRNMVRNRQSKRNIALLKFESELLSLKTIREVTS